MASDTGFGHNSAFISSVVDGIGRTPGKSERQNGKYAYLSGFRIIICYVLNPIALKGLKSCFHRLILYRDMAILAWSWQVTTTILLHDHFLIVGSTGVPREKALLISPWQKIQGFSYVRFFNSETKRSHLPVIQSAFKLCALAL